MRKLIELAAGLGLEVRFIPHIPDALNHAAERTLHTGTVLWVEQGTVNKTGLLAHEISHWVLASDAARAGWNFISHWGYSEADALECDVCSLDMYILVDLGMRSTPYRFSREETHSLLYRTLSTAVREGEALWPYGVPPSQMLSSNLPSCTPCVRFKLDEDDVDTPDILRGFEQLGVVYEG